MTTPTNAITIPTLFLRTLAITLVPTGVVLMPTHGTVALAKNDIRSDFADGGMVVSDSAAASRIGRDILVQGGNAVDAAVATAFALAVTWPEAGNIGGGGFMMIHPVDGRPPVCVDYRETAPQAASENSFALTDGRYTRKVVGVPGTVRGLALAHETYGRLPWKQLVAPSVALARNGFSVDGFLARSTNSILKATAGDPDFSELRRVYGKPDGSSWSDGDVMTLPDLAATLETIAEDGADAFYKGRIAKLLLAETAQRGGLIRKTDLEGYEAKIRAPIVGSFRGYTILGAPPPSSGGIAVIQALNMVEALELPARKSDARTLHLLAEISRRVFLDRARHLGDPDFVTIPIHLTSKDYASKLAAQIDPDKATDSAALAPDIRLADESDDTTHFSIVDRHGMAVSNTYTLEASWGSRVVVRGAGFLLNNEMGDFNWVKGHTDRRGRIGTDANLIAPGKRMLSSQCPVIVSKDGKPVLITGSPGGRTIINTVLNVLLNVLQFDMPVARAVQAKRYHHQWMPDVLYLEDADNPPFLAAKETLEQMGHTVVNKVAQGSAHTISVDPKSGTRVGVADYRRGGHPAGISSSVLSRWDFGGRKGIDLSKVTSIGRSRLQWGNRIAGSSVDGADRLVIRRDAPERPDRSFVQLGDQGTQISATVKIDGINFAGRAKNEKLQLAFTQNDSQKPLIVASMTIARNDDNQIVVYGEALGDDSTAIAPVVLSETPRLDDRLILRLTVNTEERRYRIATREPVESAFHDLATGTTGADRSVRYARLRVINDFSATGEYLRIDSLEFSSVPSAAAIR